MRKALATLLIAVVALPAFSTENDTLIYVSGTAANLKSGELASLTPNRP